MKMDMAGAAAAAAALITVAKLKPRIKVTGVIPLVENMPSGSAARPGDIVKSYSGKTIEIGNTDAEGRLILIDALSYIIKKNKPDIVIDMATLTGACVVALGEKIAGVFSADERNAHGALVAAQARGALRTRFEMVPQSFHSGRRCGGRDAGGYAPWQSSTTRRACRR